ncbi:MAG TPA: glutamate--cysteine ligase [Actinocrinis sp.]|nr:glutamate--cysteine ligase [Actinocrinis sp.]
MITVGVEEEYLLLDPETGLPVPRSRQVRAAADLAPAAAKDEVTPELLQAQVEVATPVCTGLDEVAGHLTRLRGVVRAAAAAADCRAAACGAAALRGARPVPVTGKTRYLTLATDAAQLVDEQLICGMHVHVAIPDRERGVLVLNRIRPWLAILVALGGNSPLWDGHDTGFSSWRTVVFGRWPVSGLPPEFAGEEDYRRRAQELVDSAVIRDLGQLYWLARLSEKYPTIEVRALDVQLRAEDAVTFAGLARALVTLALSDHWPHATLPAHPPELLAAALWQAARHGLDGDLVDPFTARSRPAADVVATLMTLVEPALKQSGDLDRVNDGVQRLVHEGTAATRQRRAFQDGGVAAAIDLSEM